MLSIRINMSYRALNRYCKKSWLPKNLRSCDNQSRVWC